MKRMIKVNNIRNRAAWGDVAKRGPVVYRSPMCDVVSAPVFCSGLTHPCGAGLRIRCPGLSFRGISLSGKRTANLWSCCQNSGTNAWNVNNNGNTNNNNKYNSLLVVPLAELLLIQILHLSKQMYQVPPYRLSGKHTTSVCGIRRVRSTQRSLLLTSRAVYKSSIEN